MESVNMSERPRKLPSWMAKEEEEKEKQPLRSRRKEKRARTAFYCMNEKELVEAAVSCLTNAARADVVLIAEQKAVDTPKMEENPSTAKRPADLVTEEESSACSGAQKTTYVSQSDLDITEMGTVQFTESLQHQGPEGQGPEPVQDHDRLVDAEKKDEPSQMAAESDDALQLVREIFFT